MGGNRAHTSLLTLVDRGNEKEMGMARFDNLSGEGWLGMLGAGPRNAHDRLRFQALDAEDQAQTDAMARKLFVRGPDEELPSIAFCWRTALDETYAAKGVVMKLRRLPQGFQWSKPILVPAPVGIRRSASRVGRR